MIKLIIWLKGEKMDFIKTLWKNKKLAIQLGKNDFRNRFASTSLGAVWGFLQPFVFMMTYVIVFQYILKTGSSGQYPYVVWFLPGMAMWMFCSDAILTASNSIRNYSYLVKKVVFPVDIIPIISLTSASFIGLFLIAIAVIVYFSANYFSARLCTITYNCNTTLYVVYTNCLEFINVRRKVCKDI